MHKPFLSYYITVERAFFARIYFSRASIFRDVRDLNSIREKRMIAKFPVLIFYSFMMPLFPSVLGVFSLFSVFCLHCFLPIREKYMLAKMLVGHSRTIDARENTRSSVLYLCIKVMGPLCSA